MLELEPEQINAINDLTKSLLDSGQIHIGESFRAMYNPNTGQAIMQKSCKKDNS
jgi:hypothetical protein